MNIYNYEKQSGLEGKILNKSFSSASCVSKVDQDINVDLINTRPLKSMTCNNFVRFLKDKGISISEMLLDEYTANMYSKYIDKDSVKVYGILVSTVWNKNDDVFTPDETFKALHTPMYKPANLDHRGREEKGENFTVGVICDVWPMNENREYLYPDYDDKGQPIVPDFFDIVIGIHLWAAYFPSMVSVILEGIKNKDVFISQECMFSDFGYALKRADSEEVLLLPRNEITSWMSQYLRILGGTGKVTVNGTEYAVGRWLRDFTFSGVGFVLDPANTRSILFEDILSRSEGSFKYGNASDWELKEEIIETNNKKCVLNNSEGKILWLM